MAGMKKEFIALLAIAMTLRKGETREKHRSGAGAENGGYER